LFKLIGGWFFFGCAHAYPADELMPLTCRGRVRGQEPSRGDVDDALGKLYNLQPINLVQLTGPETYVCKKYFYYFLP
uniref:Uncharacterized protein n=1 Tax=Strix occidentalis caurina TaxID=311401 RepID=A0A8D0F0K9_STROC